MFTFAVRPAYKSRNLLVEFRKGSGSEEMIAALMQVFAKAGIESTQKIDLWQNDEVIYTMRSSFGEFELSSDNWGYVFIMAPNNQPAIRLLEKILVDSALFESESVDFAQYS